MTKEQASTKTPSRGERIKEQLQGWLERLGEAASKLAGLQPRPALQPVPVRQPAYRRRR